MATLPIVLIVAGSDPSSGAGLQLDVRVAAHRGCYPLAVPSLLTVQNSRGIRNVALCEPELVSDQIACVLDDFQPAAVKLGALGSEATASKVLAALAGLGAPITLDPILRSSSKASLFIDEPKRMVDLVSGKIAVCTPNIAEAELLLGRAIVSESDLIASARELSRRLQSAVLLKGGHLRAEKVPHALVGEDMEEMIFSPRLSGLRLHGTGCALSSALSCELAKGATIPSAATTAIRWMESAVQLSRQIGTSAALHAFEFNEGT